MMAKRILVTGDTGFIGSHLTVTLTKIGHEVRGYDLKQGYDIRNMRQVRAILGEFKPHVVIHLAAKAGVRASLLKYSEFYRTNISGTQNIVNACEEFRVKHFIFYSSSSVFCPTNKPMKETSAKTPISPYGISKLTGEMITQCSQVPTWHIIRPFTVYGPNNRKDMAIHKFFVNTKKGNPITEFISDRAEPTSRGYTYVGDIVDVTVKLLDCRESGDFNVGGQEKLTVRQLIELIENLVGKKARIKRASLPRGDQPFCFADVSRIRKVLGHVPQKRIKEVLEEMYKTHYKNL